MRHAKTAGMVATGACALILSPACALASPQQQSQQEQSKQSQSVAEAARKAKEQQKTAPKAQTVWTNDTVGSVQGTVNVVGQQSAAAGAAKTGAAAAGAEAAATPTASAEDIAKLQSQLADAKKNLDSVKTDLDISQRKYNLDAAQYYGTPNYAANKQGQTMLDGEKSAIAAKKQDVDAAQKKATDLETQIRALGGKVEEAPAEPTVPQS
ncbi:MAG TPA: hypothetical protein VGR72_11715 [Candidatus Acidoferrales bacterium]|nr:hypothetical protein [Candidatus Acidoferrales bacterium]